MSQTEIDAGMPVEVLDAFGHWLPALAASGVEGIYDAAGRKIHDFPLVWITRASWPVRVPWPAEDVRPPRKAEP